MQVRNYKVDLLLNKPKPLKYELDMGKSCIRFKRMNDIAVGLVGDLIKNIEVKNWINLYEKTFYK